jgi:hypothetical protein
LAQEVLAKVHQLLRQLLRFEVLRVAVEGFHNFVPEVGVEHHLREAVEPLYVRPHLKHFHEQMVGFHGPVAERQHDAKPETADRTVSLDVVRVVDKLLEQLLGVVQPRRLVIEIKQSQFHGILHPIPDVALVLAGVGVLLHGEEQEVFALLQ